jgi:antitoxin component YwqK of YwqJK toxin-antitoxin module
MSIKYILLLFVISAGLFSCVSTRKPSHILEAPNVSNEQGEKEGIWITYYNNDFIQVPGWEGAAYYRIITYENGKPVGIVRYFYITGEIHREGYLLQDNPAVMDGLNSWYYKNGNLSARGTYKNGLREGKFLWWYENGNPETEGYYLKDKKHGFWVYWYENGK